RSPIFPYTTLFRSRDCWEEGGCMRLSTALLAIFSCVSIGSSLIAQVSTSTILGVVNDQSGAAMAGAQVTVKDMGTGLDYVVSTGTDGNYIVENVKPGQYRVSATKPGFKETVLQGINILVGERARINIQMELGAV